MRQNFIFTEAFGCGKLLGPFLESYLEYHNWPIHVILSTKDIEEAGEIINDERVVIIDVSNEPEFVEQWALGHEGTVLAFATVFKKIASGKNAIHFDADVIFKDDCVNDIISYLNEGYDIVGPVRAYKNNLGNPTEQQRSLPDTISTYAFGINTDAIPEHEFYYFVRMCGGWTCPNGNPVIDAFDPVTFDMLNRGCKIKYLDTKEYGSMDTLGSKRNGYESNLHLDSGSRIVHFAGVGSGYSYDSGNRKLPEVGDAKRHYADWTIGRWSLYSKVFFNEDVHCPHETKYGRDVGRTDHDGGVWCFGKYDENILSATVGDLKQQINI